jgi:hypothetical protein
MKLQVAGSTEPRVRLPVDRAEFGAGGDLHHRDHQHRYLLQMFDQMAEAAPDPSPFFRGEAPPLVGIGGLWCS